MSEVERAARVFVSAWQRYARVRDDGRRHRSEIVAARRVFEAAADRLTVVVEELDR